MRDAEAVNGRRGVVVMGGGWVSAWAGLSIEATDEAKERVSFVWRRESWAALMLQIAATNGRSDKRGDKTAVSAARPRRATAASNSTRGCVDLSAVNPHVKSEKKCLTSVVTQTRRKSNKRGGGGGPLKSSCPPPLQTTAAAPPSRAKNSSWRQSFRESQSTRVRARS